MLKDLLPNMLKHIPIPENLAGGFLPYLSEIKAISNVVITLVNPFLRPRKMLIKNLVL